MSQQKDIRARVGYTVDKQSVAQAVEAQKQITTSYKDAKVAADSLGLSVAEFAKRTGVTVESTQKIVAANQQAAASHRQVGQAATSAANDQAAAAEKAARAAQSGGGNGTPVGFGTFRALGSAFSNLGGGSGVTQLASLAGLGAELGVIGIAAGVTAVVLKALNAEQERQTKVYEARLDIERSAAREVAALTTQQIQERIHAAEQQLAIDKEVSRQQTANAALYTLSIVDQPLKLGAALAGLDPLYNAYQNALAKNQVAIEGDQAQIDAFTGALDSNSSALNTATAAQLDYAKRALDIDQMTTAERQKQIVQNENDIRILTELATSSTTTYDAFVALKDQIRDLRIETEDLQAVITSTADLYAREAQFRDSAKDTLEQLNDATKRYDDALEALAETTRKMAELDTETAAKRQAAQVDAEERRSEIIADGAERRAEIELQDADRREEILNQFNRSYGDALGNRDALAAVKAKEQRDDELQKQDKANKRQLDQLDKQLDKQQRAVERALEKQLRSIDDAYNKQLRTLQHELAVQNANIESALQAQRTLQAVYNQMIHNAEIMHQAAMYKTIYDYGEMARIAVENAFRSIANTISGSLNGVVGGPDSGVYPGAGVGGNLLGTSQLERDRQAAIAKAYQDYYLRQGMPAQGYSANRMPAFPRGSGSAASMNLSGAPPRGSLPNVNVTVNTPLFDRASVDKLWFGAGGIRQKIIEGLPR